MSLTGKLRNGPEDWIYNSRGQEIDPTMKTLRQANHLEKCPWDIEKFLEEIKKLESFHPSLFSWEILHYCQLLALTSVITLVAAVHPVLLVWMNLPFWTFCDQATSQTHYPPTSATAQFTSLFEVPFDVMFLNCCFRGFTHINFTSLLKYILYFNLFIHVLQSRRDLKKVQCKLLTSRLKTYRAIYGKQMILINYLKNYLFCSGNEQFWIIIIKIG